MEIWGFRFSKPTSWTKIKTRSIATSLETLPKLLDENNWLIGVNIVNLRELDQFSMRNWKGNLSHCEMGKKKAVGKGGGESKMKKPNRGGKPVKMWLINKLVGHCYQECVDPLTKATKEYLHYECNWKGYASKHDTMIPYWDVTQAGTPPVPPTHTHL